MKKIIITTNKEENLNMTNIKIEELEEETENESISSLLEEFDF